MTPDPLPEPVPVEPPEQPRVLDLTLYVNGASDLSHRAIANARRLCDGLAEPYHLSVVDVNEVVGALRESGVLAVPTLVKSWPLPVRKLVGDLSRPERVLEALGLEARTDRPEPGAR